MPQPDIFSTRKMKTKSVTFARSSRTGDRPTMAFRGSGSLPSICTFNPHTGGGGWSSVAGNGEVRAARPQSWPTVACLSSKLLFLSSSCLDPKRHASYNRTTQRKDEERTARSRDREDRRGPAGRRGRDR